MLACVRIGAIHSVVFGGFAAASLATRIDDAQAEGDGHRRRRHARRQGRAVQAPGRRGVPAREASAGARADRRSRPRHRRWRARRDATSTTPELREKHARRERRRASGWNRASPRTSSTRPAPPASRRACSATPAATRWRSPRRCATSSAWRPARRCSPPATSAGWSGHSYIIYGAAPQRLDDDHVRGAADPSRSVDLVEDRRRSIVRRRCSARRPRSAC